MSGPAHCTKEDYAKFWDQIVQKHKDTVLQIVAGLFNMTHSKLDTILFRRHRNRLLQLDARSLQRAGTSFRAYTLAPNAYAVLDMPEYIANLAAPGYQLN